MATLKSIWKDKEGNYVAIINLEQTEILMCEDRTVPPGILVPPKESECCFQTFTATSGRTMKIFKEGIVKETEDGKYYIYDWDVEGYAAHGEDLIEYAKKHGRYISHSHGSSIPRVKEDKDAT